MKITTTTIELTTDDLRLMLDIIAPLITCPPSAETAPAHLLETARKFDKALKEAQLPTSSVSGGLALKRMEPTEKILIVDDNTPSEEIKKVLTRTSVPSPRKTVSDGKLPTSASAQPKMEMPLPPKSTADKLKAVESEPKPGKVPPCVRQWSQEELNLLRTCSTDEDAKFVYESHFADQRSPSAIRQKWYKLNFSGEILRVGDHVQVIGGHTCQGDVGDIVKFTDDHQYASVVFFRDPATYQFKINDLKKVEKE